MEKPMGNEQTLYSDEHNRYKYVIENIKDVIWEMDSEYVYTFISPNAKDLGGYEADEMIGRRMPEFLTKESQTYAEELSSLYKELRMGGMDQKIGLMVLQFLCKDKTVKWVEVSAKPIFKDGRFKGYIGTTRDITEKKEYERRLERYVHELRVINEKLEKTAAVDSLTGAYNRRKFDDELNFIITEREKHAMSFSLIFLDIDYFKKVNDLFGHKTGDSVLQDISELIRKNIRTTDTLFRWGGEEFMIILPETDLKNAIAIAEKIRSKIEGHSFGFTHKITISLGVGEYKPDEDTDQILMRLDDALMKAKAEGRNRVVAC
jgi:diguanylate cyclase (GGDEF)-like protein/PAS domain S-box-containing protein